MPVPTIPDRANILKQSGFWYWNPSGLSTESEWGTQLGFTEGPSQIVLRYNMQVLSGEEGYAFEKLFTGYTVSLSVTFKSWTDQLLSISFPGFASGSARVLQTPANLLSGRKLSTSYSAALLFVPRDGGEEQLVFLAQQAVPHCASPLRFSATKEVTLSVNFDLLEKGTGSEVYRCFYCGPIDGAVLL